VILRRKEVFNEFQISNFFLTIYVLYLKTTAPLPTVFNVDENDSTVLYKFSRVTAERNKILYELFAGRGQLLSFIC
jgi:hypothetical protein